MTSHEEMPVRKAPDTSTGYDGAKAPHKLPIRTLVAASVGNAVEWYDWTVYATLAVPWKTRRAFACRSADRNGRAGGLTTCCHDNRRA